MAIETAQMVLMKSDLRDVFTAIDLSQKTFFRIRLNFLWAFFYNVVGKCCARRCSFTSDKPLLYAFRNSIGCWIVVPLLSDCNASLRRWAGDGVLFGVSSEFFFVVEIVQEARL